MITDYLFSQISENQAYPVKLSGYYSLDSSYINVNDNIYSFVNALLSNKLLELEFFKTSYNLSICIKNERNKVVYQEKVNTAKTFHLIVNIEKWKNGAYSITINNHNGISIFGHFLLLGNSYFSNKA